MLIGRPSTTCVPRVATTMSGSAARSAPAITDRAALPVQRATTSGIAGGAYAAHMAIDVRQAERALPHRDRLARLVAQLQLRHATTTRRTRTTGSCSSTTTTSSAPAGGFGTHSHRDMEIVTWVLDGELEHRDSTGTVGIIYPGLAQRMSAGSGIQHSETNASATADVHLVQMWVLPDTEGIEPGYEQHDVSEALERRRPRHRRVGRCGRGRGHDPPARRRAARRSPRARRRGRGPGGAARARVRRRRHRRARRCRRARRRATRCGSPTRARTRSPPGPTGAEVLVWANGVGPCASSRSTGRDASSGERRAIWLAEAVDGELVRLEDGRTRERGRRSRRRPRRCRPRPRGRLRLLVLAARVVLRTRAGSRRSTSCGRRRARDGERWLAECNPPFWGRPGRPRPELPAHLRVTEAAIAPYGGVRPKSTFQVGGNGSVGTGSIRGWPIVGAAPRSEGFAIWPFDDAAARRWSSRSTRAPAPARS